MLALRGAGRAVPRATRAGGVWGRPGLDPGGEGPRRPAGTSGAQAAAPPRRFPDHWVPTDCFATVVALTPG
eukprot:659211-Lingulodinium_polyedra.AAC.1